MGFAGPSAKIDDLASIRTEWPIGIAAMPANALGASWATNDSFSFSHAVRVLVKTLAVQENSVLKLHEPLDGFAGHQCQPPCHCQVGSKWHWVFAAHVLREDLHDSADESTD